MVDVLGGGSRMFETVVTWIVAKGVCLGKDDPDGRLPFPFVSPGSHMLPKDAFILLVHVLICYPRARLSFSFMELGSL